MRKLLRRLAPSSCSGCRDRVSAWAVACADCGADLGPTRRPAVALRRDSALVWLLGGAVVGCLTMLALAPQP
jgi:hypothetical protein